MPFNGNGVYQRTYDFTTDRDNNILIVAERMDAELDGLADAVNAILGGTQAFRAPVLVPNGTEQSPAFSFSTDTDTGIYLSNPDTLGVSVGGTKELEVSSGYVDCLNGLRVGGQVIDPSTIGSQGVTTLNHSLGSINVDLSNQKRKFKFEADVYTASAASIEAFTTTSQTNTPIALPGSPQEGDVVAVMSLGAFGSAGSVGTSGYTQQFSISTPQRTHIFTKPMGAVPDSSVEISSMGGGGALIILFRGVDNQTPLDAPVVREGTWSPTAITPNPPPITVVTSDSLVLSIIISNSTALPTGASAPSGYTKLHGDTIIASSSVSYYRAGLPVGTHDPGPYGSAIPYREAFTTAWRAGSTTGLKDYDVTVSNVPQTGYAEAELHLETKTGLGVWTWPAGNWIGGSAPPMNTVGVHVVKIVYFDGVLQHLEYVGERAA